MKIKIMKMRINFVLLVVLAFASSATALTNPPGFLSIDCGAPNDYDDENLEISYRSDNDFISTGKNMQVSSEAIYVNNQQQLKNMRIFPNGTRNCYKLSPDQGKQNTYLIRASFWYGNYDGHNQVPSFDLYIDVNYWATVNSDSYIYEEIIYVPPRDDIQLCLVNTGSGVPFISAIELRLLDNSTYRVDSGALVTNWRYNFGGISGTDIRHPADVYDRIWSVHNYDNWNTIATNGTVDGFTTYNDAYKVPASVLTTAAQSVNATISLSLKWNTSNPTQKWYIYFHFGELQVLQQNQTREFGVYVLGKLVSTVRPEFGRPVTVASFPVISSKEINFTVSPTKVSNLPAILNAVETMYGIDLTDSMTALNDVKAMNDIKTTYDVRRDSWQGDPCSPRTFSWDRLNCSYDDTPRIISLNLSSSKLVGKIANSISNLTALTSLDLSNNQLTEEIPKFLGDLPNLKFLNLTGNNLSGPIPEALKKKIKARTLQAIFNADLCQSGACATSSSGIKKNNVVVPAVPAFIALAVFIILIGFSLFLWRNRMTARLVHM